MFDASQIKAITLDLDDTLWPIWPTIDRAEVLLLQWMAQHAPAAAQRFDTPQAWRAIREEVGRDLPALALDLHALRIESIRRALHLCGEDEALAQPAFDVFFAARQQVDLFDDVRPALEFLAARWPVVAVTNGNADVNAIGIGHFFQDTFNVQRTGVAKPDVRIFEAAWQSLGVQPHEVLHVGDDARLDAVAARNAGMCAVWLNRSGLDWPEQGEAPPVTVSSLAQLCALLAGSHAD